MDKLIEFDKYNVAFWCPGCRCLHSVNLNRAKRPFWTLTGGLDVPTLTPSVLYSKTPRCHSFVNSGRIRFLDDCGHDLVGQIVDLEDPDRV